MTEPVEVIQADREGPAPAPTLYCVGCKHLKTEYWREYMCEDDEWDSGTTARCHAVNRSMGSYWHSTTPTPDWCPHRIATTADKDAELQTVLCREAATTARYDHQLSVRDVEIDALKDEVERLRAYLTDIGTPVVKTNSWQLSCQSKENMARAALGGQRHG